MPKPLPSPQADPGPYRACPGCGARNASRLGDLRFELYDDSPLSGDFGVFGCRNCGLGFHDTRHAQADFDRYYRESGYYFTASTTGSGGGSPEDERRYRAVVRRLRAHLSGRDPVIMDIGCGKGGLLRVLEQEGFRRVYGVDMLPSCVRQINDELGFSARTGSAQDLPFPELKADALIYSHVVEHVLDLATMLSAAREKLNAGGRVYVEVPDAARYREFAAWPYQELYLEHVNHFDLPALLHLFGAAGFTALDHGADLIRTAPGRRAPCLWAVFAIGDGPSLAIAPPSEPSGLAASLADYLAWSRVHPIMRGLDRLAARSKGVYLWGISQAAMLLLGLSPELRRVVRGLVDRDEFKQTRTLMGFPIRPPESLKDRPDGSAILVTALGAEDGIRSAARGMGIEGPIWTLQEVGEHDEF